MKQALQGGGGGIPVGATWHRDLLVQVEARRILKPATAESLRPYMAFRHFFSHAYALDLDYARMEILVDEVPHVVDEVLVEVLAYVNSLI